MKKLILIALAVILYTISTAAQLTVSVIWDPGTNWNLNTIGTYLYMSTNDVYADTNRFATRVFNAPRIYTNSNVAVNTNALFSMYITAADTNNLTLESDVSNQVRFQLFPYVRGQSNQSLTLKSYTAITWAQFLISQYPTNGILSGTPPNLVYTPTNTGFFNKDRFVYKSPETFGGTNIFYTYSIYFYWFNSAPVLREIILN